MSKTLTVCGIRMFVNDGPNNGEVTVHVPEHNVTVPRKMGIVELAAHFQAIAEALFQFKKDRAEKGVL